MNTWYYLAGTYDGTTARIYVNGVQTGSATLAGGYTTSSTNLSIGSASWFSGGYTAGQIDEFAFYNRALSPSEVLQGVNNGVGIPTTDQRGFLRSVNGAPDIGAYERQPYVVTSTADSGPGSLRQVLATDSDGSPITFASVLTGQTITLASELLISGNASIDGSAAPGLVLSGAGVTRVVEIASGGNVTLSNLSVEHGSAASDGGGILNGGTLTLSGVTVASNTTTGNGGGIENLGTLTVVDSTIASNTAGATAGSGGGIDSSGTLSILDSTIAGNIAFAAGGISERVGHGDGAELDHRPEHRQREPRPLRHVDLARAQPDRQHDRRHRPGRRAT